ncbi:MAG: carboxypeptidase regulatory-like domain-containing protein [Saprospiraceae bacterium]
MSISFTCTSRKFVSVKAFFAFLLLLSGATAFAQITTSSISGLVVDPSGEPLIGVTVVAEHLPSGTRYGASTNATGRYFIPAVRVGGPFAVTATYTGYESVTREGIMTNLGVATNVNFEMLEAGNALSEVSVVASRNDIFSSDRTGTAQTFSREVVNSIPIIGSRSINDITKYNPNGDGRSFGAQDSRLNNFTIDGSVFNNGFGLGSESQAGGRTGSTAISLDAIEELQVNVAPFDVRQSGFVGSGINAITRSGNNDLQGSVYYMFRNNEPPHFAKDPIAAGNPVDIGQFQERILGARLGGAIIKNKLFYFVNYEQVRKTEPATSWVANGSTNPGQVTRVEKADLEELSDILRRNFGYETGPYEAFDNATNSDKFMARLDYNINDRNRLTLRYTHHNSVADVLISNSQSLGSGNRRTRFESMSYQNSGYLIGDNTRSIVAELNSTFGENLHNNFIIGYDLQNEDRQYKYNYPGNSNGLFPTIDILKDGATYISAGMDPFTPENQLNYGTFHVTNNVSVYKGNHTFVFGANYEYYKSNNNFFPGSHGVWIFNSFEDAKTALNAPNATVSPVNARFQYRYSALPEFASPLQVLQAHKFDLYAQDEYQITRNFRLSLGLRASIINFEDTGLSNPVVDDQQYTDPRLADPTNRDYRIFTGAMPKPNVLWEPRLGFNWNVKGKKATQIRGGTGIFTGRPPYVWVSNAIGNNGVLTGFIDQSNTNLYPFTPDPTRFRPETPTLPSTFDIATVDPNYKFPQVWKSVLAVDQKLPLAGIIASVELMYNKNVNAVNYFDANAKEPLKNFDGVDKRPQFHGSANNNRINANVSRAAVLTTTNEGYYQAATFKLELPSTRGVYAMAAYTRSEAKDIQSAGSIASGSWTGIRSVRGNNFPDLAFSDNDIPHRVVGLLGYRLEYGGRFGGATQISLGYVGTQSARINYTYNGDMNRDGINGNDLIYIPTAEELSSGAFKFEQFNQTYRDANGVNQTKTFTIADQQAAFEKFIQDDDYLRNRRGQYAERNGKLLPWLHQLDLSVVQEMFVYTGKKRNTIQLRADILNFGNLLNSDWGVGYRLRATSPLGYRSINANNEPVFRMVTYTPDASTNVPELLGDNLVRRATPFDVWTMQLGIRYIFD